MLPTPPGALHGAEAPRVHTRHVYLEGRGRRRGRWGGVWGVGRGALKPPPRERRSPSGKRGAADPGAGRAALPPFYSRDD